MVDIVLTRRGLDEFEFELAELSKKRPQVQNGLRAAREIGGEDNTDFALALETQAFHLGRTEELKAIIQNAYVVENDEVPTDCVGIGSVVSLKDSESGDTWEWSVVGTLEADPSRDRISNESVVGEALMGRTVGDKVEVDVPAGHFQYEIVGIRRPD